jgi:hypothetical protein
MPTNEAVKKFSEELKTRGILVDKLKSNISTSTLERVLGRHK